MAAVERDECVCVCAAGAVDRVSMVLLTCLQEASVLVSRDMQLGNATEVVFEGHWLCSPSFVQAFNVHAHCAGSGSGV